MAERPIMFSGAMVRAVLENRKTQTRRVAKLNASGRVQWAGKNWHVDDPAAALACPYGQPGDGLWVRETWGYRFSHHKSGETHEAHCIHYAADDMRRKVRRPRDDRSGLPRPRPRGADEEYSNYYRYLDAWWRRWRPSIHMPRWASRLDLRITGIRAERLNDISAEDAAAEGWPGPDKENSIRSAYPIGWYAALWDSINGVGAWDKNPWVWVIEFERQQPAPGEK